MTRRPWRLLPPGLLFHSSHSFALSCLRKRTSELPITVLLAHKFCRRTIIIISRIGAIVGEIDAAAPRAIAPELIGDEAPSNAPMPAPPPNTSRPPLPIVSKPLLGKALAAGHGERAGVDRRPAACSCSVPLRINAPPPLTLSDVSAPVSLSDPAMVNALPVEALTSRLLTLAAKTIGAAIVWLPPLLLIVAVPVRVRQGQRGAVGRADREARPARVAEAEAGDALAAVQGDRAAAGRRPCRRRRCPAGVRRGPGCRLQLPAVLHEPLPVCQTPLTTLGRRR